MSMLDAEALPEYRVMFLVTAIMAIATAAVLFSPEIQNGYVVLSAPIGIGTLILGLRAYLAR